MNSNRKPPARRTARTGSAAKRSGSTAKRSSSFTKPPPRRVVRAAPASTEPAHPEGERLQKVLAAAGVASRRAVEDLIAQGRVSVDGEIVRTQGRRVHPEDARIEVDGERVNIGRAHEYVLLNKPSSVVTTTKDPEGRRTVMDLVKTRRRVFPVGRLDADTVGLLLLTSNGELANRLIHPRYEVPRTYVAEVKGEPTTREIGSLVAGIRLEDGVAIAKRARILERAKGKTQVEVVMGEGRKHEVRRMFEAIGYPIKSLVRTRFGALSLGDLRAGKSRPLTPVEVGRLLKSVGL